MGRWWQEWRDRQRAIVPPSVPGLAPPPTARRPGPLPGQHPVWADARAPSPAAAGQPPGTYHMGKAQEAATAAHLQLQATLAGGTAPPEVLCQLYLWTALAHAQMARVQIAQAGK